MQFSTKNEIIQGNTFAHPGLYIMLWTFIFCFIYHMVSMFYILLTNELVNANVHWSIIFSPKVDEIRQMIEKISCNVDEVKKKHSAILSAPQTDDSKYIKD